LALLHLDGTRSQDRYHSGGCSTLAHTLAPGRPAGPELAVPGHKPRPTPRSQGSEPERHAADRWDWWTGPPASASDAAFPMTAAVRICRCSLSASEAQGLGMAAHGCPDAQTRRGPARDPMHRHPWPYCTARSHEPSSSPPSGGAATSSVDWSMSMPGPH